MHDLIGLSAALVVAATLLFVLAGRRRVVVQPWETGLVYRDGEFDRTLGPGVHWRYAPIRTAAVIRITTIEQGAELGPIEVYSREGFAFRLTLAWTQAVADPRAWYEAHAGGIYPGVRLPGFDAALTAAAMAEAAARPLADLLADPQPLAVEVMARVAPAFLAVTLANPAVARLQLPPEVRRLFTEVEAARLQGLAALERARGEQAALRSLANAARLVRDNPELAQLRLLQAIETAKRPATIVLGTAAVGVAPPGE